jgi:sugar lactone lactonase YvrE
VATMMDKHGGVFEAAQNPDGSFSLVNPRPSAHLGPGRPLGAAFNAQGDLYVCDALKGLLLLRKGSSQVEFVASRVSGSSPLEPHQPIIYANDLDIASDGMVYFTTSVDIILHRYVKGGGRGCAVWWWWGGGCALCVVCGGGGGGGGETYLPLCLRAQQGRHVQRPGRCIRRHGLLNHVTTVA